MKRLVSLVSLAAAGLLLTAGAMPVGSSEPTPAADGRVIVLGFDGADARTVGELVEKYPGRYPTFEKLAAEGTFAPLEVVAPPESPVSWAALNTGQNPAKTGVPGFIQRLLPTPIPFFGHIKPDVKVPISEFENVPTPEAPKSVVMGAGAAGLVLGLLIGAFLLRKPLVGFLLGALLAGGAVFGAEHYYAGEMANLLPDEIPVTQNPNQAKNFWDYAAEGGVKTVVLDAAQAFDMKSPDGAEVLAGLGYPDARGGLGDWFIYTTNPEETEYEGRGTTTAGTVFRVDATNGRIDSKIYGPRNFWKVEQLKKELDAIDAELRQPGISMDKSLELSTRRAEVEKEYKDKKNSKKLDGHTTVDMSIEVKGDSAVVTMDGQAQTIALGEWSQDYYELTFELNALLKVHAITRARVIKLDPYVEVYVNVLDVDPRQPPFWQPLTSPVEFSGELATDCGLFETYGWPTMTMPVKDGEIDSELLMEDVEFTMKWREKLTHAVLDRNDWQVFMSVFSTTDRVQHMMYRYYDELHPQYDAAASDRTMTFFGKEMQLRDAIPSIYEQMDRVIGEVLERLNPEDTLMVCSDHGFQSFRRQVNVNNWLIENGYLAMKPNTTKKSASFLAFVDWENTRMYSLGMGFLYVNQAGREKYGTVPAGEADALMAEVREKLLAATDQDDGTPICRSVYVTKEVHNGPYLDKESDMIIGFAPNYRVSWSSTSGGVALSSDNALLPVCTDNDSPWSGGHISVNLPDVAGVFFSNKKVDIPSEGVRALQVAPTVLSLTGVAVPSEMDLPPLTVR